MCAYCKMPDTAAATQRQLHGGRQLVMREPEAVARGVGRG